MSVLRRRSLFLAALLVVAVAIVALGADASPAMQHAMMHP